MASDKKLRRNLSTPESRAFWKSAEESAKRGTTLEQLQRVTAERNQLQTELKHTRDMLKSCSREEYHQRKELAQLRARVAELEIEPAPICVGHECAWLEGNGPEECPYCRVAELEGALRGLVEAWLRCWRPGCNGFGDYVDPEGDHICAACAVDDPNLDGFWRPINTEPRVIAIAALGKEKG